MIETVTLESVLESFGPLSRPAPEATGLLLHGQKSQPAAGPISIYGAVSAFRASVDDDGARRLLLDIPRLDRATRGFEPGELVIALGRTASLKTMLLLNLLCSLVRRRPASAFLLAECEMPCPQLVRRAARMVYGVTDAQLDTMVKGESLNFDGFCELFQHVFFVDQGTISLKQLDRYAEDLAKQIAPVPLDAVLVDHAGLLKAERNASAYERASSIAIELKQLARRLKVVVICIVQANRAGKSEDPVALESARDSGCFEENADFVLSFGSLMEPAGQLPFLKLRLSKNRRGPCVPVTLGFDPLSLRMRELDEERG